MEQLIVTLVYMTVERVADLLACGNMVSDTLRHAPGLVSTRLYRSRGEGKKYETCCLVLTTWENDESWQQAQEHYNPRALFQTLAAGLLSAAPEQWSMRYLWGYNRPAAAPLLAAVYLASTGLDQLDYVQRSWLKGLRRQAIQPNLSFAFLACGVRDGASAENKEPVFLNFFSWSSEAELERFYSSPYYQAIETLARSTGNVRVLSLEPL